MTMFDSGTTTAKNRNFSLYPEQEALLLQVAKDFGLGSMSAALRFVVHDWLRLRAEKDGYGAELRQVITEAA